MSYSANALKEAIEMHKIALEKYKEAINSANHDETRAFIKELLEMNNKQLESAQWIVMGESAEKLETEEAAPENGATKLAAGKCPFSGQFKEMGIDLENFDMEAFKKMGLNPREMDINDIDIDKLKDMSKS